MVEMVVEGELSRPDLVIFADTGDEPDYVYRQVEYLNGRLKSIGMEVETVSGGNMVDAIYSDTRFASIPLFTILEKELDGFGLKAKVKKVGRLKRQCTSEYKIEPIERRIRDELVSRGLGHLSKIGSRLIKKGVKVESWLGITLDEVQRMKSNRTWFIDNRYPLIDKRMTRQDCTRWLMSKGLPVANKSSCIRCPFHDDGYYLEMKNDRPGDWSKVTMFDDDLRSGKLRLKETAKGKLFLHRSCQPLKIVPLEKNSGQMSLDFCDEGYCWT
jgi:hypothetical protein